MELDISLLLLVFSKQYFYLHVFAYVIICRHNLCAQCACATNNTLPHARRSNQFNFTAFECAWVPSSVASEKRKVKREQFSFKCKFALPHLSSKKSHNNLPFFIMLSDFFVLFSYLPSIFGSNNSISTTHTHTVTIFKRVVLIVIQKSRIIATTSVFIVIYVWY